MKKLFSIALFFIFANIFVPEKKSFYITTDNLKVRENEVLNGKALFTLKKDSRVFVLEIGKKVYHSTYSEMPDDPHYIEGDFEVKNEKIISDIFGKDEGETGEIDFEYNCDIDNYEIEGFYSAPRTYDSLFYDEENDMLFRKSGAIFIEEECIFYGKPSESSSKATIKELFYFQNEDYKFFNLDRVFAETQIETY